MSFVRIQSDDFKKAVESAIELIEPPLPVKADNIVLKPNLCYYWDYSTGQTTDPAFVEAIVKVLRDKYGNPNIVVVESDASAMKCSYAFRILGYEKLAKLCGIKLLNLTEAESNITDVIIGNKEFRFNIPKIIKEADLRINIPKPKRTMAILGITCALKNIFGCNPYRQKSRYHNHLGEVIVALNKAMAFDLCIVDGNIVLGAGTAGTRRLGLAMASQDPVAIDVAGANMLGIKLAKNNYVRLASQEGIGNFQFIPRGIDPKYFSSRFPREDWKSNIRSKSARFLEKTGLGSMLKQLGGAKTS